MVSVLDYGLGGLGSSPGQSGTALIVLSGKTSYSHSASLHPGVFTAGGNPAMDWHHIQGGSRNSTSHFMPQKLG